MNKEKIQTVLESRLERTFEPKFLFDGKEQECGEKRQRYTIAKDLGNRKNNE
jgi:hypothetical protein